MTRGGSFQTSRTIATTCPVMGRFVSLASLNSTSWLIAGSASTGAKLSTFVMLNRLSRL